MPLNIIKRNKIMKNFCHEKQADFQFKKEETTPLPTNKKTA